MRLDNIEAEGQKKIDELNARLKLEKDAADERNRKEYESKMKAAEDSALAFANALDASTGNFTTRLDSILKEVRNVSRVTGRR